MKVAVSACLLGVKCRYDGKAKPSSAVETWLRDQGCEAVRICPEVAGGLPIPHPPHEIASGHAATAPEEAQVIDCNGVDHTAAFVKGARKTLARIRREGCEAVILKSKSPSCGLSLVYDGTFTDTLVPGDGMLARLLCEAGIPCCTEKDIEAGSEAFPGLSEPTFRPS